MLLMLVIVIVIVIVIVVPLLRPTRSKKIVIHATSPSPSLPTPSHLIFLLNESVVVWLLGYRSVQAMAWRDERNRNNQQPDRHIARDTRLLSFCVESVPSLIDTR